MSCYFKHSKRIYVVQNMPQTTIMMEILFTQRQILPRPQRESMNIEQYARVQYALFL